MKCKVCKKEFELKKENMYLVRSQNLSTVLNRNVFEAFDCMFCGCQNVVNERYPILGNGCENEEIIEDFEVE